MDIFETIGGSGHERVVLCSNPDAGLKAIVAIHSTVLGPGLGGARMWPYASTDEALTDVLRVSRGMTYKAAAAGGGRSPLGAGKAAPDQHVTYSVQSLMGSSKDTSIRADQFNPMVKQFNDKLRTGSVADIAEVLRDLCSLKGDKDLSYGEKKMLDKALAMLVCEISASAGRTEIDVQTELNDLLLS